MINKQASSAEAKGEIIETKKKIESILLVRHGESLANLERSLYRTMADHAIPLSENGEQQAAIAGVNIKEYYQLKIKSMNQDINYIISGEKQNRRHHRHSSIVEYGVHRTNEQDKLLIF